MKEKKKAESGPIALPRCPGLSHLIPILSPSTSLSVSSCCALRSCSVLRLSQTSVDPRTAHTGTVIIAISHKWGNRGSEQSCHSPKDECGGWSWLCPSLPNSTEHTSAFWHRSLGVKAWLAFAAASSHGAALKPSYPSTMLLATVTPRFSIGSFTCISHSTSYKGALVISVCISGNGESHFPKINMLSLSRLQEPTYSLHLPVS